MQDKMMNELKSLTTSFMPAIEAEMRDVLGASGGNPSPSYPFYGMIHYHMGWANEVLLPAEVDRGKRIRPILCLLACAAAGADWQVAVPAAAAVEILHNFSLVHDDIEDVSPTRRGRPTLWTIWGQAQAINTGDAMFAMSHLAISRLLQRGVEPEVVVRALRRFDETCVELTRGQYIDMSFEARDTVSVADYVEMITGKTAVLVALCAELGALIAGADDDRVRCFSEYGLNLGLAFQVQDDILGIWGDESLTGKSAATDIVTRKKSLPVLYALARSQEMRSLYDGDGSDGEFVQRATKLLNETGAHGYAAEQAEKYSQQAMASLEAARPAEPAATALHQLTDMLLQRRH